MASVRKQILDAIAAKLEAVRVAIDWTTLAVNPRSAIGEAKWNAIVLLHGGERDPSGLTGHVERRTLEFSVGLLVRETEDDSAEELIDAAYVAVSDALLDPDDIQLGGLAEMIWQGGMSEPLFGRAEGGARVLGAQTMDFGVQYLAREGDAATVGP